MLVTLSLLYSKGHSTIERFLYEEQFNVSVANKLTNLITLQFTFFINSMKKNLFS